MKNLYRLSAFPKTPEGGNKAGVYVNADHLTEKEMQEIAYEVGYSETAFVMKSDVADFKVRFFTPINEVPLCGHATIATFNLLRDLGLIKPGMYRQETLAGVLALDVKADMVFMQQPQPIFDEMITDEDLMACFPNVEFAEKLQAQVVSTGLREIFLPVRTRVILDQLKPDIEAIVNLALKDKAIGIHAFCLDEEGDAYGRNFEPVVGVNEESATGTSNGALGCYLYLYHSKKDTYVLRQGYSMGQPSEILTRLDIDKDVIDKVWVGGTAHILKG